MYKPRYHITNELLNKITQIEEIRSRIGSSYILPEREIEMRYRATVEATHSSTSIEGNPLNLKQVEKALSDKAPVSRHQYAEIEVRNYKKAIDFIDKRKTTAKSITAKDILEVHRIIIKGLLDDSRAGRWRKHPIYIENQNGDKMYDGPSETNVPKEVESLLDWINNDSYNIHPVIASAIFHFQCVSIHPFADGNGRSTRILTALYLGLRDYDFRGALVLDSYYSIDKNAYYNALSKQGKNYSIRVSSELNPWLDYFADGFLASANVLATEVALLSSAIKNIPVGRRVSSDEVDILSYIQQFGSITLTEAEGVLHDVPRRTIQRKFKNLVDAGYIRLDGATHDAKYVAVSSSNNKVA